MSRRAKLIILGIFLVLLAFPAWQVFFHWDPPNPLRFRIVSREPMPPIKGYFGERLQVEVHNTSGSPQRLEYARWEWMPHDADETWGIYFTLVDPRKGKGPVIPGGGIWRAAGSLATPKPGMMKGPGSVRVSYTHTATVRQRVLTGYWYLCSLLPKSYHDRLWIPMTHYGNTRLED